MNESVNTENLNENKSHISFESLLSVIRLGPGRSQKKREGPIKGAINGGYYYGAPGKDIFLWMPFMTDDQMEIVSEELYQIWPKKITKRHEIPGLIMRYLYGHGPKNGIFYWKHNHVRKNLLENPRDYSLPRKFSNILKQVFEQHGFHRTAAGNPTRCTQRRRSRPCGWGGMPPLWQLKCC